MQGRLGQFMTPVIQVISVTVLILSGCYEVGEGYLVSCHLESSYMANCQLETSAMVS